MSFDETGRIRSLYTFLYGKDEEGEVRTYLVNYETGKNNKMTVWIDGETNAYFEESMRLEPMLQILQKADVKTQVEKWGQSETYEILYYGSRYYEMEKSRDGGHTWETVNQSPFGSNGGVAEGLVFVDEQMGFAGLTGASQSYSQIYMTKDGGSTWATVDFPMENVAELPEMAKDLGFSIADYDYFCMPELEDGVLKVLAITEAGEQEGIWFWSEDNGESWSYAGVVE